MTDEQLDAPEPGAGRAALEGVVVVLWQTQDYG
jgi:hypothetical protein